MTSSVMGAAVNIVLNIILIKTIGIAGAAIATLASYIVVFVYRIIDTKKYLYMKVYWAKIAVNLILLSGMACSIMFLKYGTLQNVINAVIFLLIAAINFQSCIQAVKLILNRRKAPPPSAQGSANGAPRNAPNGGQRREPPRSQNSNGDQYQNKQYKDKRR